MQLLFKDKLLEDLYKGKKVREKAFKSNPTLVKQYVKVVQRLINITRIEDLYQFHALNYEKLVGDRKGKSSVRINDQYRLIFEELTEEQESTQNPLEVALLALEEISNHYD